MAKQKEPTRLKIIKGNPSDKKLPKNEPACAPLEDLTPPSLLKGDDELAAWLRIVPILKGHGVLSTSDVEAVVLYCRTYGTYMDAYRNVRAQGVSVSGVNGGQIKNPAATVAHECGALMYKILSSFGMTPSARSGVEKLAPTAPLSGWDAFEKQQG